MMETALDTSINIRDSRPTKLYLITGFLGAGKTTFLKNLIQHFKENRLHIIVNEFGREGIDGQLLSEVGLALDEINNGSIFCSCRLDKFEEVLAKALATQPDMILIEASGLSNPTNIKKILAQPGKFPKVDYLGCICLVDARQFPKVYDTATVVKKQIAVSDILIINKTDLTGEAALTTIEDTLSAHRPDVPIFRTTYGQIQPEWFASLKKPALAKELPGMQKKDITLHSYLLTLKDTFSYYDFQKFVEMFLDDTYRVKGFVTLDGKVHLTDCVGNMFKAVPYKGEVRSLNELVILSGNGLPTRRSVKEAMEWYPDHVIAFSG